MRSAVAGEPRRRLRRRRPTPPVALCALALAVTTACSGAPDADPTAYTFVAPDPPYQFASGLTIEFVPAGYEYVRDAGHESAAFHVFEPADGSALLSVGVQFHPSPHPNEGESVTRGGREFTIYAEGQRTRVRETADAGDVIDVLADSLDTETLLDVAASIRLDLGRQLPSLRGEGTGVVGASDP